jgi:predicted transcriptional regulator
MKKLFILIIAFFSTLFISCEKDLYEDSIKDNSRKLKIKKVSLSDIDNNTSFKILEKVKRFKNLTKQSKSNQNNQSAKFAYNDALDLYIDYDNGKVIESEGSLFYTFPMFRKSEENLENILFIPKENGDIESYILKYDFKPEDLETITANEISQKKIEYQPLVLSDGGLDLFCGQVWELVAVPLIREI